MQALLELDCIPAGMELFPAANEDQWTLIKKVIDDCDYYIVIVAGRYGSLGAEGTSCTEMEYKYALESGKPVIGFLHKDPGSLPANRCESDPENRKKLENFRSFVQKKMCRFWESPADLGSQVSRSLVKLIKNSPGIGWVRGDLVPDQSAAEEILHLKGEIEKLQEILESARTTAPEGSSNLQQGDDDVEVAYQFMVPDDEYGLRGTTYNARISISWNAIFAAVGPTMIDETSDNNFKSTLDGLVRQRAVPRLRKDKNFKDKQLRNFATSQQDFNNIKVQLRALGYIGKSTKHRSLKDTSTYWTRTPYGDTVMTRLLAIRRDE